MARTVLLSPSPVRTFPPPSFEPHLWSTKCLRSTLKLRSGDPGIGGNGTHEQKYGNAIRVVFLTRSPVNGRRSRPPEMPLLSPASSPCLWAQCLA